MNQIFFAPIFFFVTRSYYLYHGSHLHSNTYSYCLPKILALEGVVLLLINSPTSLPQLSCKRKHSITTIYNNSLYLLMISMHCAKFHAKKYCYMMVR